MRPRVVSTLAVVLVAGIAEAQGTRAAFCGDTLTAKRGGTVIGRVLSRRDSAPAAGAHVVGRWYGRRSETFSREARTDNRGAFRICGVPLETALFLRANLGLRESAASEVRIAATETSARVDLLLDLIEDDTTRAAPVVAGTIAVAERLDMTGARTVSLARYNAASGRGTVVGVVRSRETGAPLPFADLFIEPFGAAGFTSGDGRFRLSDVPAGAIRVRARRIGSMPVTVNVSVRANETDTLSIALGAIALQLARVRVNDAVCPNRSPNTIDTTVVTILQQLQLNAERARLVARQHPFEMVLQRVIANEARDRDSQVGRLLVDTLAVDTVTASLEHEWRYEPGHLVRPGQPTGIERVGAPDRMAVPQLVDYADSAFVATHCFRFAGVGAVEGRRMLRVNFEPIRSLRERDVSGALYFDTLTYQIRRSTLSFEYPSPRQAGDIWVTRVDTWFRDIVATLPVIERITQRTTVRTPARPNAASTQAAWEEQRLIDVRFLGLPPNTP